MPRLIVCALSLIDILGGQKKKTSYASESNYYNTLNNTITF